jgi:hypothetical protein
VVGRGFIASPRLVALKTMAYIRPKVVEPFPRPCARGSYVHRAAFFFDVICSEISKAQDRFIDDLENMYKT